MELYLKIDRPGGKKFFFVENGKIRRLRDGTRPSVTLYPDRPTDVKPEADAKGLQREDPHLVTTEKPDFAKPFPTTDAEWKDKVNGLEDDAKESDKDVDSLTKQNEVLQVALGKLKTELEEQKAIALKAVADFAKFRRAEKPPKPGSK